MLFTLIDLGVGARFKPPGGIGVGVEDDVYGGGYVSGDVEADVVVGAIV